MTPAAQAVADGTVCIRQPVDTQRGLDVKGRASLSMHAEAKHFPSSLPAASVRM